MTRQRRFRQGKDHRLRRLLREADTRIAITGGTGAYKEAAGQLTVTDLSDGNTLLVFQFTD